MYNPYDFYFKKAQKSGFKARSAFKLEEIQDKFKIFDKKTKNVLDIGCAPGSWLQYAVSVLHAFKIPNFKILGFDIKPSTVNLEGVVTYVQDITIREDMQKYFDENAIDKFDVIMSDMAHNTIGIKDIDAIKLFALHEQVLRVYREYLRDGGRFVIKVFMGPGFDEFVKNMKTIFGGNAIKVFKPQSCRKESKETYVIKI